MKNGLGVLVIWGRRHPGKQEPHFAAYRCPGLWWFKVYGWGLFYLDYASYPRHLWTIQEQATSPTVRRLWLLRPGLAVRA